MELLLMGRADLLEETLCWERFNAEEKGTTEDEMVGWHHRLNGHEFEQTLGGGEGQGSLVRCSPWGRKGSDTTQRLNNSNNAAHGKYLLLLSE